MLDGGVCEGGSTARPHSSSVRSDELNFRLSTLTFGLAAKLQHIPFSAVDRQIVWRFRRTQSPTGADHSAAQIDRGAPIGQSVWRNFLDSTAGRSSLASRSLRSSTSNEDWTHGPFFGTRGTFFADVDGDGRADAIVVNDLPTNSTVTVRRSNGTQFLPNEDWTHGPYWGSVGNAAYFVDVTGDGCADAIVINNLPTNSTVTVRRAG